MVDHEHISTSLIESSIVTFYGCIISHSVNQPHSKFNQGWFIFFPFLFLILTQGYVLIDFREKGRKGDTEIQRQRQRERERKRERKVDVRDKHQLVASCTHPNQGSNPQPRYVP